jgi:hypothetical protein
LQPDRRHDGAALWFVERQQLAAADVPRPRRRTTDRASRSSAAAAGQGRRHNASNHGEIIAVCDVDETHAEAAAKKFTVGDKVPAIYSDFRKVMERNDIHVIVNATPDHWHTLVNMAAAKGGQGRLRREAADADDRRGPQRREGGARRGIVLQTGTQQRSSQRFRLACELVRNNRIGALRRPNVWLPPGCASGPFPLPVPQGLDWDFWQGQTPATAYVKQRCHTTFRYWYDYSGGTMTDWGAHHNDIAYWAIGLLAPTPGRVEGALPAHPRRLHAFADYA